MEENIFHDRGGVLPLLRDKYVELRLETDVEADWSRRLAEIKAERLAGDGTMPYYEIVDPRDGRPIARFAGGAPAGARLAEFIRFLRDNADPAKTPNGGF